MGGYGSGRRRVKTRVEDCRRLAPKPGALHVFDTLSGARLDLHTEHDSRPVLPVGQGL